MEIVKRLRAKTLGNPKKAAAALPEKEVAWLGTIYGMAHDTKAHKDQADETKVGFLLLGFFEGQSVDGTLHQSAVLMLSGPAYDRLVELVRVVAAGKVVQFALRVGVRKAENSAGYEYVTDVFSKGAQVDPVEGIRAWVKKNTPK